MRLELEIYFLPRYRSPAASVEPPRKCIAAVGSTERISRLCSLQRGMALDRNPWEVEDRGCDDQDSICP